MTAPELEHLTAEERVRLVPQCLWCRRPATDPLGPGETTRHGLGDDARLMMQALTALNAARAEVARMREAVGRIIGPAVEDAAAKRTERELLLDQTTRERDEARAEVARLREERAAFDTCVRCETALEPEPVRWCIDCGGPDCSTCGAEGVPCDDDCPERLARESRRTYAEPKP